jgi:hypothetical protein
MGLADALAKASLCCLRDERVVAKEKRSGGRGLTFALSSDATSGPENNLWHRRNQGAVELEVAIMNDLLHFLLLVIVAETEAQRVSSS